MQVFPNSFCLDIVDFFYFLDLSFFKVELFERDILVVSIQKSLALLLVSNKELSDWFIKAFWNPWSYCLLFDLAFVITEMLSLKISSSYVFNLDFVLRISLKVESGLRKEDICYILSLFIFQEVIAKLRKVNIDFLDSEIILNQRITLILFKHRFILGLFLD